MMFNLTTRLALGLSTATFLTIGGLLVLAPQILFATNGIALDPAPAMMSEIRAPGVLLLLAGVVSGAGFVHRNLARVGLAVSAATFLSYGLGRIVSIAMDGLPPDSLVLALALELGLAALCGALLFAPGLFAHKAPRITLEAQ